MEKCKCWEETKRIVGWYGDKPMYKNIQICNGTKEREECDCNGDKSKCNFYPEKRKESKIMNTTEMWLKAQKNGCCYETTYKGKDYITLYYQKDKGLFDDDQYPCKPDMWESFDELMNEQWQLRTMTKSEAEAKFNIKIVGD